MPRPAARRPSAFAAAAEVCEARRLLTTFVVTDSGDATDDADGALTYREALLAAEAEAGADVITFADGVEGVILEADLPELTGDLTVAGSAAGVTVDHAGFGGLTLSGGTFAFSGVRFENAARDAAAALDVSGGATLTVTGGSLGDNRATADGAGGVVRLVDSDATFTGVLIQDNAAAVRGGIAAIGDSELRLVDVTAVRNDGGVVFAAANGDGDEPAVFITGGEWGLNDAGTDPEDSEPFGNIRLDAGSLTVTGGRFSTNVGGVIRAVDANVTVTGGYFALNRGGAVSADGRTLAVADATFSTNFGGAIYSISARTTVADSLFFRNENEDRSGGAIRAAFSTVTVTDSTFRGNTAVRGGAVSADRSSLSLIETRMFGNGVASPNLSIDADEGGAVLIGEDADVTVEGGRYALNRARFFGGAFAARPGAGSLSLSNLSLNRNVAGDQAPDGSGGPVGRGGGLYAVQEVGGPLEVSITNVFAARNRAEGGGSASGGGAYLNEADLTVADSNFAGNAAGGAGGNVAFAAARATFTDTFLRGGEAAQGGGLFVGRNASAGSGEARAVVRFAGGGLIGNGADGRGGGLRIAARFGGANAVTLDGARVRGNRAAEGGAAFVRDNGDGTRLTVTGDSVLRNNRATDRGGAFAVEGRLVLDGVTAVGNRADAGSVAFAFEDGEVRVLDALFRGNGDDSLDGPGRIVDRR